jgi:hypothetical protein
MKIKMYHIWTFFFKDVYVLAVPALSGPYDSEVQKRLIRAEKRKILEDLKEDEIFKAGDSILMIFTRC